MTNAAAYNDSVHDLLLASRRIMDRARATSDPGLMVCLSSIAHTLALLAGGVSAANAGGKSLADQMMAASGVIAP